MESIVCPCEYSVPVQDEYEVANVAETLTVVSANRGSDHRGDWLRYGRPRWEGAEEVGAASG